MLPEWLAANGDVGLNFQTIHQLAFELDAPVALAQVATTDQENVLRALAKGRDLRCV